MKKINLVTNQLFKLILGSSQYFFFPVILLSSC